MAIQGHRRGAMNYRREVDGLRAVAVSSVVLFHAGIPGFESGYVGVDIFFVISGFLITSLLLEDLATGSFSLWTFYERRVRRILPALFFVTATSALAGCLILLPADLEAFSRSVIATVTFWSNFLFWSESGYFDTSTALKPLLHTWSLAVEEQYYILFPPLLAVLWVSLRRGLAPILLLMLLASIGLSMLGPGVFSESEARFYLLPTRAWQILAGAMVAVAMYRRARFTGHVSSLLAGLGLALIGWAMFSGRDEAAFPGREAYLATLGAVLVVAFEQPGSWTCWLLGNRLAVGLGLISYSAYLWHQPLFAFSRYLLVDEPARVVMVGLVVLSVVLAYPTYRFVERPFRDRERFTGTRVYKLMAAVGVALLGLGAAGLATNGAEFRFDQSQLQVFRQFENPGAYVRTRFNALLGALFDPADQRRRLLIVGDSHAQDVVNAITENPRLAARFQLSTYYIPARCGNLFVEKDLVPLLAPADRKLCSRRPRFEDKSLRDRLAKADEVWLVSSWRAWQVPFLPETLRNLRSVSEAKVRILGGKNFGSSMSLRQYWRVSRNGNPQIEVAIPHESIAVSDAMRAALPADVFVDLLRILCGPGETCRNSTAEGLLMSYDGSHLTQAGARAVGERLLNTLD